MHRQCAKCPGANIGEMIPISNKVVDTGRVTYQVVVGSIRPVEGMGVNEHCSKRGVWTREKTEQSITFRDSTAFACGVQIRETNKNNEQIG